ncbi:MAG TPA: DNA polymerase/3'-5' exonuclease PolX [Bryobacteraceae bacterium]|nr:DNA polymerase/3'-5' exonuclease PolX [Bryobacteraceae bacterium]
MDNKSIARLLNETADLMEVDGADSFRIRSYRNAAGVIESNPEQISGILADANRSVTEIAGIGKGIAAVLTEIEERGSFERRDEMLEKYPPTALELLHIQGLGPKSIRLLFDHYRCSSVDDLERLCKEQKLRDLPRMGAKLEEKVLRSIQSYRQRSGRYLLNFASSVAAELSQHLAKIPGVDRIVPAGSLRRGRETVGDLDLLVTGPAPGFHIGAVLEAFVTHPRVTEILGKGANKASVRYGHEAIQVDLRALPEESFGAALQYFTGSKDHNVALRQRALKMGYTLSEYALARVDTNERVAGATEEEIYEKLGMVWIPPELRENWGEIEAAAAGPLPKLVDTADIRGDLHMHTTETDGRATLEEMAQAAHDCGYEYIAITDHSKALAMANGLDEKRAIAFAHQIREMNRQAAGIRVFSGLECDIRRDGVLDLEDDALASLDFVVASVHSYMNLEASEMTDRLLRALENPHVRALGHPTGRMLLHREAYAYEFEKIAAEAARRHVYLEINASPERLDLGAAMIRAAKSKGCKFVISTDAHHPKHLLNMNLGVKTARRGWLEPSDILNTLPLGAFERAIHLKQ